MASVRYSVVLDWDEMEELFIATVPALSVSTYGESREEVIEKVREAVLVTIEGLREIGQAVPQGDTGKVEVLELEV